MKNLIPCVLITFFFSLSGCNTVDSGNPKDQLNYQVSKCLNHFSKTSSISADSCFTYSFSNSLIAEYCVSGNCCPDSNRFAFIQETGDDTLNIFVTDIEENQCHCICSYMLHSEFTGLQHNTYLLNIYLTSKQGEKTLLYSETVMRNNR
jgi:hypothetical protein